VAGVGVVHADSIAVCSDGTYLAVLDPARKADHPAITVWP